MINSFKEDWLNKVLPGGLEHPASTLISGPGGSGKPLVGLGIVRDWLENDGNIIFVPLQYPKMKFVRTSLRDLYNLDVKDYSENVGYVKFGLEERFKKQENRIVANLLEMKNWKKSINELEDSMKGDSTLVFASALNLLLFSPSYKKEVTEGLEDLINKPQRSYLFTVSTSAYHDLVKKWEKVADNLLYTRMEEGMNLFLKARRLQKGKVQEEARVPLDKEKLQEIKKVAMDTRQRRVSTLSSI